jgi:hypothetical protein
MNLLNYLTQFKFPFLFFNKKEHAPFPTHTVSATSVCSLLQPFDLYDFRRPHHAFKTLNKLPQQQQIQKKGKKKI